MLKKFRSYQSCHEWSGIQGVGVSDTIVEKGMEGSCERRFFISSFAQDVKRFAHAVRGHWGIESTLHWTLDMSFAEDASRIRKNHGPENLALLRRMALGLLKQTPTKRTSIRGRRLIAGWDDDYMFRVLFGREEAV